MKEDKAEEPQARTEGSRDPGNSLEMLERLAKLRDQGILSEEEFLAKKADILAKM